MESLSALRKPRCGQSIVQNDKRQISQHKSLKIRYQEKSNPNPANPGFAELLCVNFVGKCSEILGENISRFGLHLIHLCHCTSPIFVLLHLWENKFKFNLIYYIDIRKDTVTYISYTLMFTLFKKRATFLKVNTLTIHMPI